MKNLIIVGAGEFGLEIWSWLKAANGYGVDFKFKGFIDDNLNSLERYSFCNDKVICSIDSYQILEDDIFVCAISNLKFKKVICDLITFRGGLFMNLIHHSVILLNGIQLGIGNILSPNCILSNNCKFGNHIALNFSCTIGHDVEIEDYCHINSQSDITGHVKIATGVFAGSRITIIPKVKIAANTKIGAGSVVIRNTKEGTTVFGNPAKIV